MSKRYYLFFILVVFLAFSLNKICRAEKIFVSVSVPPQKFFVEKIGGEHVNVQVMLPPGASPATYEPTPKQLVNLERSEIYIKVGHPNFLFEKKYFKVINNTNKNMKIINMSEGLSYIKMSNHDHDHDHDHQDLSEDDPHVWVAPYAVRLAVDNICNGLCDLIPSLEKEFILNRDKFIKEINDLDRNIKATLKNIPQKKFMIFHPALGYFAKEYGLTQIAIETGGKEPSPSRIARLIVDAQNEGIRVILVQKGFSKDSAQVIARQIHGRVVEIDPLEYDWLANMKELVRIFKFVLDD